MPRKIKRTVKTEHGDWLFSPGRQSQVPCRLYYEMTNSHIGDATWPYIVTRSRYKRHARWIEEIMHEVEENKKVPVFVVNTLLGDYRDYG